MLLVFRRFYEKYPFFLAYIFFSIIATVVGFSARNNYQTYFEIYWTTEALYALLALLALHEAFHAVFIQDFLHWKWFWMVFPGTVLVLSAVFIGNALLHPAIQAPRLIVVILSFGTVVNCVKGGLFLMFLGLAWLLLGKSWPTYPYGVVLGFAVSALGSVAAFWARSIFGTKFNVMGKYGPPVSYILGVLIWIASCFLPSEPRNRWAGFKDPENALATVRHYKKALKWMAEKDKK
ncbi:MAG TPA: hypothetical protein VGK01_20645 [Candidatus Angelobacter sp.]